MKNKKEHSDPQEDRVEACLAACAGISTEALRQGVVGEMRKALATIAYEPIGPADASYEDVDREIVSMARAVLAKLEGK